MQKQINKSVSEKNKSYFYRSLPALTVVALSFVLTAAIWIFLAPPGSNLTNKDHFIEKSSLFAHNYPANGSFQEELVRLKANNLLKPNDELEIHKSLLATSEYLEIPPALFWCLLFQESRLNHLEGINEEKPVLGIGQFSRFSFYEINHQLERYNSENTNLIYFYFGHDIRPIAAKKKDLLSTSSYYSIPTGVISSGLYLSNRYKHLSQLLTQQNLSFNPELLWLFSAMAYNKGSRSIVSLWNTVNKKQGRQGLEILLNDYAAFQKTFEDTNLLTKSLKRIWEESKAKTFAKELRIHAQNIAACSVSPMYQPTRELTGAKP